MSIARATISLPYLHVGNEPAAAKGAMLSHGERASNAEACGSLVVTPRTASGALRSSAPRLRGDQCDASWLGASLGISCRVFNAERIIRLLPEASGHDRHADLLYAPSRTRGALRGTSSSTWLVRFGFGSAFGRNPQGVLDATSHVILERYGMTETT